MAQRGKQEFTFWDAAEKMFEEKRGTRVVGRWDWHAWQIFVALLPGAAVYFLAKSVQKDITVKQFGMGPPEGRLEARRLAILGENNVAKEAVGGETSAAVMTRLEALETALQNLHRSLWISEQRAIGLKGGKAAHGPQEAYLKVSIGGEGTPSGQDHSLKLRFGEHRNATKDQGHAGQDLENSGGSMDTERKYTLEDSVGEVKQGNRQRILSNATQIANLAAQRLSRGTQNLVKPVRHELSSAVLWDDVQRVPKSNLEGQSVNSGEHESGRVETQVKGAPHGFQSVAHMITRGHETVVRDLQ